MRYIEEDDDYNDASSIDNRIAGWDFRIVRNELTMKFR